jgi:hypothetical protein
MAADAAAFSAKTTSDSGVAQDHLTAVAVLDEALDTEGNAVRIAADRLLVLLAPSPASDGEIEARDAAATSATRGQGYRSEP